MEGRKSDLPLGANFEDWKKRYDVVSPSAAAVQTAFAGADGTYLTDVDGRVYLNFSDTACTVGARNQRVVEAVKAALDSGGVSKCRPSPEQLALMEKVREVAFPVVPDAHFIFTNSGAHANESAMMLARSYTRKSMLISYAGGHYGAHLGSLALSAFRSSGWRYVQPLVPGVVHVPYPYCYRCPFGRTYPGCDLACLDYVRYTLHTVAHPEEVAAIFIEPIAQKCGVVSPPEGYLPGLRRLCQEHDILLVANEVATGIGRTGRMFAMEHWDTEADIMCLGKAFANGLPMAGVVAPGEITRNSHARISPGTFGANRVCCTSALATLTEIQEQHLLRNASQVGEHALQRFREMAAAHPLIGDVRGKGVFWGIEVVKDRETKEPAAAEAKAVEAEAFQRGLKLVVIGLYGNVIRLTPPLSVSQDEVDQAIAILEEAFTAVGA